MARARILASLVIALAAACGGEVRDAEGLEAEPVPELVVAPPTTVARPSLYDEEGNLLASDRRVAGLTMPLGLEPEIDEERHHTFVTTVPLPRLLRYFGPRLTTGQVEERPGGGASYRAAIPREVTTSAVRIDVTLTAIPGGRSQVDILEIPPEPASPPSEAESLRAAAEAFETAE